jgi:hypothetical protein
MSQKKKLKSSLIAGCFVAIAMIFNILNPVLSKNLKIISLAVLVITICIIGYIAIQLKNSNKL